MGSLFAQPILRAEARSPDFAALHPGYGAIQEANSRLLSLGHPELEKAMVSQARLRAVLSSFRGKAG
jgi:hypothetical protein